MRKILLCLGVVFGFVGSGFGQDFEWVKGFGGNSTIAILDTDSEKNTVVAGKFSTLADFDPGPDSFNLVPLQGTQSLFIQKLDSMGVFLWAKSIDGFSFSLPTELLIDNNNNIYIIGNLNDSVTFITTQDPGGIVFNNGIFILKMDSNGNFEWVKNISGILITYAFDISLDLNDNIYISGAFSGSIDFDPGLDSFFLSATSFSVDGYILKIDSNGDFVWVKGLHGLNQIYGDNLIVDSIGNIFTTGRFSSNVDLDPGPDTFNVFTNGLDDIFIQKLDSLGNFMWGKSFGGPLSDSPISIGLDQNNNIIISGTFKDTVDFNPNNGVFNIVANGQTNLFVQKLDNDGNFVWVKAIGPSVYPYSSDVDTEGAIYVTGSFWDTVDFNPNNGDNILIPNGSSDIFVQKLDQNGNLVWAGNYGSISSDEGQVVKVTSNFIYIAGYYRDTLSFNSGIGLDEIYPYSSYNTFILKLSRSSNTPIVQIPFNTLHINIFPNPTTGKINLELGDLKDVSIKVHSIDGQLIYSKENINESMFNFDIKDAASGVYIIEVEANEGKMHYKLIKQ